jgi:DHA3 family macrolide efflux protein-like MFS transporter
MPGSEPVPTAEGPASPAHGKRWQPRFFAIWSGQAISLVGSALVQFALIWWLTETTDSPTILATATIVATIPVITLGPFAGVLVDRLSRRWVMVISDTLIATCTAVLAVLFWLGRAQVWHVYVVLFLRAFGDMFQFPAMRAATSLMVPKEQLTRVGGMNETLFGVVTIVSPPLGALLLDLVSVQGTLAIDMATAVLAIAPLLFMRIPEPEAVSEAERPSPLADLRQGLRFVWNWRGLLYLLLVMAGMRFFLAPAFSLLPLMVTQHFGGGALQLAWLSSAHGFGFIAGGLILSAWGGFRRRTVTALTGLIGVGIGFIAFGLMPAAAFIAAIAVMFVRTAMVPMIRGSIMAIFQEHVPPDIQGRVFTLLMSTISFTAPLGLAVGGPLAEAAGVPIVYVVAGCGILLMAVLWGLNKTLLNLEGDAHQARASAGAGEAHAKDA